MARPRSRRLQLHSGWALKEGQPEGSGVEKTHVRMFAHPWLPNRRQIPLERGDVLCDGKRDLTLGRCAYARKQSTGYVFLAPDGQPFTSDRLHDAMQRLCRRAKFRRIGWHTLRHTFASLLAMRGVPLPAIKELLGHAAITTTMRYAHVAPSTLRAAIEMLNPKAIIGSKWQPAVNQWQQMQRDEAA